RRRRKPVGSNRVKYIRRTRSILDVALRPVTMTTARESVEGDELAWVASARRCGARRAELAAPAVSRGHSFWLQYGADISRRCPIAGGLSLGSESAHPS